jgi:hypothetical protein
MKAASAVDKVNDSKIVGGERQESRAKDFWAGEVMAG